MIALGSGAGAGNKHAVKKLKELTSLEENKARRKELSQRPVLIPLFDKVGDSWQTKQ